MSLYGDKLTLAVSSGIDKLTTEAAPGIDNLFFNIPDPEVQQTEAVITESGINLTTEDGSKLYVGT